jgi:hypothetical protein
MQRTNNIRLWLLACLLFAASSLHADEEVMCLHVTYTDGGNAREAYFSLEDNPEVIFNDETKTITINSTDSTATYLIDNCNEMDFVIKIIEDDPPVDDPPVDDPPTEIMEKMSDAPANVLFRLLDNDLVKVMGKNLSHEVSVYGADGRSVNVPVDYTKNEINIRLGSLPRGIYIIKTNQQSFKFIRK